MLSSTLQLVVVKGCGVWDLQGWFATMEVFAAGELVRKCIVEQWPARIFTSGYFLCEGGELMLEMVCMHKT